MTRRLGWEKPGQKFANETVVFVNRLGNLLLLPPELNSKLGAKDPIARKPEYLNTGLAIAADVAERIPKWDRAAIEKREEELIAWAWTEDPVGAGASRGTCPMRTGASGCAG